VRAIIGGDTRALKSLYSQYSGLFYTIARRYFNDSSEAEDMVQDCFVHIYKKAHTFSFKGSFEGWMKRILVNLCLSALKKKRLKYDDTVQNIENVAASASSDWTLEKMNAEEILKAMELLPDGCRTVMNMNVLDGFTHAEIAAELGITESASRSQLTKARAKLRHILEERQLIER